MPSYTDYPPVGLHDNDNDVVREITVVRYVLTRRLYPQDRKINFTSESDAKAFQRQGDSIHREEIKRYILVDKDEHRRSHWCISKDQCVDYAVAYAPDKRPDFGKDEYTNP